MGDQVSSEDGKWQFHSAIHLPSLPSCVGNWLALASHLPIHHWLRGADHCPKSRWLAEGASRAVPSGRRPAGDEIEAWPLPAGNRWQRGLGSHAYQYIRGLPSSASPPWVTSHFTTMRPHFYHALPWLAPWLLAGRTHFPCSLSCLLLRCPLIIPRPHCAHTQRAPSSSGPSFI